MGSELLDRAPEHQNGDSLRRTLSAFGRPSESAAEERRNRLLRRIDWRFLLPDPNPDKAICFVDDPLLESVRLIAGSVVDGRQGGGARDCDLAVAVDPNRETLELARSSLRPGGFLYSEWRGFLRHGTKRLCQRLEAAGFEGASFYWPRPDPSVGNPAAWIPLQGRSAIRHYFIENRGKSRTPLRRVARRVMRATSAAAPRLRLAQPICAFARKPGAAAGRRNGGGLDQFIAGRWASWQLGTAPRSLSCLLLTGGLRSNSKVIVLVFSDSSSRPLIALKMPRTRESALSIEREASVLRSLAGSLGPDAPEGVPRLLFLERRGPLPILGETAFTGVPLLSAWTHDNYGDLALKASAWQADLASRRPLTAPEEWWPRLVAPVLAEFTNSFGRALDSRFLGELEAPLKTLPPLPLVCEQRDFSPWNILLTPEGELAVVDWESAEPDGLPALDLIYFLAYLCFSFDSARVTGHYRESYRCMLDPNTPLGSLSARCISLYRERIGLDWAVFRPLRILTWLVHARSEYHRLLADFGQTMSAEILRGALCVQLLEEELRNDRDWGRHDG